MSAQQSLIFDAPRSRALKRRGMQLASGKNAELVEQVRDAMRALAVTRMDRCVSADDAAKWLAENGHPEGLGNAAGSLFKNGEWEWTGRFVESGRTIAHSNLLRVWRLQHDRPSQW